MRTLKFSIDPSLLGVSSILKETNLIILRLLLCMFLCASFLGCGEDLDLPPTVPAEGIVTLDGTPVADATVVFIAEQGTYNATGVTDSEGKFEMRAFQQKPGAVVGSYKVELSKSIVESVNSKRKGDEGSGDVNMKFGLPKKYSLFNTSGITFKVPEAGDKNIKFELKSK